VQKYLPRGADSLAVFAAPKRIGLKSHLQLSGVLVNDLRLRHPMSQRTFGRFWKAGLGRL